ncbi:MAG: hypothetical protein FWG20_03990, partial [Candidatus Cloacimonetes bacterium]|nr:hypothetical protein [Candidatus Cloacimonadota bacterium]
MKKKLVYSIMLCALILFCGQAVLLAQEWKQFTNTSHMRDMAMHEGKLAIATWGGVEFYNIATGTFDQKFIKHDGLSGNNVIALASLEGREL